MVVVPSVAEVFEPWPAELTVVSTPSSDDPQPPTHTSPAASMNASTMYAAIARRWLCLTGLSLCDDIGSS